MILQTPDSYTKIHISNVIIDKKNYTKLNMYKWRVSTAYPGTDSERKSVYAYINGKQVYMHRFILNAPKGLDVDHINRNPLDNRKCNLRIATRRQNNFNRRATPISGYAGVYFKKNKSIFVRVTNGPINYEVTGFTDIHDAVLAYNELALLIHKDTAVINDL
jgi:hypothetical protein